MTTTLCFDFGNSRLKCGVFIEDRFMEEIVLPNDNEETILQLLECFSPQKTILSSVINHNKSIETILEKNTSFHIYAFAVNARATKASETLWLGNFHENKE